MRPSASNVRHARQVGAADERAQPDRLGASAWPLLISRAGVGWLLAWRRQEDDADLSSLGDSGWSSLAGSSATSRRGLPKRIRRSSRAAAGSMRRSSATSTFMAGVGG